jgi:hypothetical protein
VVLAAATIVLLICRGVRFGPRQRRGLGWVLLAFGVAAILFAAFALTVIILGLRSTAALALVYGHQWFGVLALPVVFFIGLLHQRLQFASIGVLVRRLEGATADNVEALLRATLRDPHLRVLFPVPGRWLDAAGRPCPLSPDDTRTVLPLGNPPVALLLHDPTLAEDSELLASAASAAFLALDNARLRALAQQLADAAPVTLAAAQLGDHAIAGGPVFISYSRTDRGFVQRLAAFLTAEGIAVWFDNSIETGERFARIIQRQIDTCPAVIVVMTPAAMASEWVDIEITYAVAKRKPIMPVLLTPCEATILLAGLIWEDVTTGALPSRRFLAHLRTLIGHTTPPHSTVCIPCLTPVTAAAHRRQHERCAFSGMSGRSFCSRSRRLVRAVHRDFLFAESSLYGPLVGVHAFGDLGCEPALLVESCSLVDLFGEQTGSAHRHVVPPQYPADCLTVDSELVAQFVHSRSGLVTGDELLDVVRFEVSYTSWFPPLGGWWRGCSRVGQFAE